MKKSNSLFSTFTSALGGAIMTVIALRVANVLVDKAIDTAKNVDTNKIKNSATSLLAKTGSN